MTLAIDHEEARFTAAVVASVSVGGLPIAVLDRSQSARLMVDAAIARRGDGRPPAVITSANGQVISMCARDPELRRLFLAADLIHADGTPLVFASRLRCRTPLPERVATTDLFHDVARLAEARGASFYLLGGSAGVIEKAICNVRQAYPRLTIAGYRNGYFKDSEAGQVVAAINDVCPLTVPRVPWEFPPSSSPCRATREPLHVGVIKTSGGLFDFPRARIRGRRCGCRRQAWNGCSDSRSSRAGCCCAT